MQYIEEILDAIVRCDNVRVQMLLQTEPDLIKAENIKTGNTLLHTAAAYYVYYRNAQHREDPVLPGMLGFDVDHTAELKALAQIMHTLIHRKISLLTTNQQGLRADQIYEGVIYAYVDKLLAAVKANNLNEISKITQINPGFSLLPCTDKCSDTVLEFALTQGHDVMATTMLAVFPADKQKKLLQGAYDRIDAKRQRAIQSQVPVYSSRDIREEGEDESLLGVVRNPTSGNAWDPPPRNTWAFFTPVREKIAEILFESLRVAPRK